MATIGKSVLGDSNSNNTSAEMKVKALGFELIYWILALVICSISYVLVFFASPTPINESWQIYGSAFAFISPCALEGISCFVSVDNQLFAKGAIEIISFIISAIIAGGILILVFARLYFPLCLQIATYGSLIYLIKYASYIGERVYKIIKTKKAYKEINQ